MGLSITVDGRTIVIPREVEAEGAHAVEEYVKNHAAPKKAGKKEPSPPPSNPEE